MARYSFRQVLYADVPGACRWMRFKVEDGASIGDALEEALFAARGHDVYFMACAHALGRVPEEWMTPERARLLLDALAVADGAKDHGLDYHLQLLAVAVCTLPMRRRALLYYVCCDRLGYDPAESDMQPERM